MNSMPIIPPVYTRGKCPRRAKTILIVDDFAPLNDLLARYLNTSGYRVLTALNATDARQIAIARPKQIIDLLLTDLNMPGGSGDELAAWFSMERPDTRIVMMVDNEPAPRQKDQITVLPKPFSFMELDAIVRSTLASSGVHSARDHDDSIAA